MPKTTRSRPPLDLHRLSGHEELFRVTKSAKRDPAVESWLKGEPAELRLLAKEWFRRMQQCGSDVRVAMHDGCPVACIEDAPFAYVNAFKQHINVGFFQGAALKDPCHLLEGIGKRMRHLKLKPGDKIDGAALETLIVAAYTDIKARLKNESSS